MLVFISAHQDLILSALLAECLVLRMFLPNGVLAAVINGLKMLGAKAPSDS